MYKVLTETTINQYVQPIAVGIGVPTNPFKMGTSESESASKKDKHEAKSHKKEQVTHSPQYSSSL